MLGRGCIFGRVICRKMRFSKMQEMIQDIVQGKIEYERGSLDFSVAEIEIVMEKRETVEGSFTIYAPEGKMTEGYVISSDNRMVCPETHFVGAQDEIAYCFHGEMLEAGQTVTGNFKIISNHGEYVLPFKVMTQEAVLQSSLGPIRNLFHFVNLAKTNWQEAVKMFYMPGFINILAGNDSQYIPLYKSLSGVPMSAHNMEAFLANVGKKKPVELFPDITSIKLDDPVADARYQFAISRNGWGYARMRIETEGDFIYVDEHQITEEDFLGNIYPVYYYINCSKLHEGNNYGSIKLLMDHKEQIIPVVISVQRLRRQLKMISMEKQHCTKEMMDYYKAFKMKRISSKIWMTETDKQVDRMIGIDEYDLTARLYKVQMLITEERINEARWELDQIKVTLLDVREKRPELWCYYLYLMTLYLDDEQRVDEIVEEIGEYYKRYESNWRIAYLLSCVSPEFTRNPSKKWDLMESLFEKGCKSPVVYLELALMLQMNPTLLHKLDAFELQILSYALKNNMIKSELRIQFVSLAQKEKVFNKTLLRILMGCYKDNPQDDILQVICAQLIKDNRTDKKAFYWYALGVQQGLRITRLFEFYMMSLDRNETKSIPKTVLLYFSYHSDLDYRLNAFLYAYVTKRRDEDPTMYERYAFQMEEYMMKQLEKKHINKDLAYLYTTMYNDEKMTPEIAAALAEVLFVKEIHIADRTIRRVIIAYDINDKEMAYPVIEGVAKVPMYISGGQIALEDLDGNRYITWVPYQVENLFTSEKMAVLAAPYVQNQEGFDLHVCFDKKEHIYVTDENAARFLRLLESELLKKEIKKEICMKLLEYYYDKDQTDVLDQFIEKLPMDMISEEDRSKCLKYLVIREFYSKAYAWLKATGSDDMEPRYLVRLCTEILDSGEGTDENGAPEDTLLQLMLQALKKGKYNEKILLCLCEHYMGTLREMRDLWNACIGFGVDTANLEKKLFEALIYTGGYIAEKKDIFRSYMKKEPDVMLLAAVMTQSCYDYFVKEKIMEAYVFEALPMIQEAGITLDTVCGLAYLKYYAENKNQIGENQIEYIRQFAIRMLSDDIKFSCCREFVDVVPQLSMYLDKTVVEYHTKPGVKVVIHYVFAQDDSDANDYFKEEMEVVYAGVYEKTFILFFGDTVQYYITEEDDGKEQLTESGTISKSDIGGDRRDSRFEILNDMMIGKNLHDYDTVDKSLEEYYWKDYLVTNLFGDIK